MNGEWVGSERREIKYQCEGGGKGRRVAKESVR